MFFVIARRLATLALLVTGLVTVLVGPVAAAPTPAPPSAQVHLLTQDGTDQPPQLLSSADYAALFSDLMGLLRQHPGAVGLAAIILIAAWLIDWSSKRTG